jgi:hypothetical protein
LKRVRTGVARDREFGEKLDGFGNPSDFVFTGDVVAS